MPRKTRRQKILSGKRRLATSLKSNFVAEPRHILTENVIEKSIPSPAPNKEYILSEYDKTLKQLTLADLKKTLLITLCLFALEFFVFYAKL